LECKLKFKCKRGAEAAELILSDVGACVAWGRGAVSDGCE